MSDRRSEAGVTLIELMIAVLLLAVVMVPLTGLMIDALKNTAQAQQRLSESRSPLFTSTFFADDAQSADATGITVPPAAPACGGGTNLVSFTWSENATQYKASYVSNTVRGQLVLQRNFCKDSNPVKVTTVAPVVSGTPTVICTNSAGSTVSSCAGTTVRRIELDATTPSGENNGFFKLIGTRRAT
jgi:Tfp pilus assembly protein PilV